ncbi:MAG: TlyA family RNA methyltransferase [Alphaproteobacteria bacterium]|nr:TlyA family RNA methyltransferase [Alphaproteobacteria bacterium]
MSNRQRLDDLLVQRGYFPSRSRARDAVLRGTVRIAGGIARKPGQAVAPDAAIDVADDARHYVSRAALKLKHGLDHFHIDVAGRRALDIGASTGGFTQVLLEKGAAHVTAIDVGHAQLKIIDPRVTSIEGLNARDLSPSDLSGPIDLVVCDVSFISLKLALPPALGLAEPGATLVALVKPQFEVGREHLGKSGVVGDAEARARVCNEIAEMVTGMGWRVLGVAPSPISGGDGNQEFLIAAWKV